MRLPLPFREGDATCLPESQEINWRDAAPGEYVMQKSTTLVVLSTSMLIAGAGLCLADGRSVSGGIGDWQTTVIPGAVAVRAVPSDSGRRSELQARADREHALEGIASYYWQGEKTASGEPFDKKALTAAHPTLPFNSLVRVTDRASGGSVVVRINDRGPFKPGRVIDLSEGAAEVIGMKQRGLTPVELEVLAGP